MEKFVKWRICLTGQIANLSTQRASRNIDWNIPHNTSVEGLSIQAPHI
jgi:hypothetical protein